LLLIGFGVGARADILSGWGDADLFAALALGTAALILGVVSKALGERAAARLGDQRALIFKT